MREKTRGTKKSTIFSKISRPFLAVMIVILVMYTFTVWNSVLAYLEQDAVAMFEKQVETRGLYLESNMERSQIYLNKSLWVIAEGIEEEVAAQGKEISDIHSDGELNQHILAETMEHIIQCLRECGGTEIFLIMDGPGTSGKENEKAGIYIRNSNPEYFSEDNQDLLFEKGIPQLSKKWGLPLDTFWSSSFIIGKEERDDYFNKPIEAARESEGGLPEDYAYWDYTKPVDEEDRGVFTYSLPIFVSSGEVIGVLGIGIHEDYFAQNIDYKDLGDNGSGAYILASTQDQKKYQVALLSGYSYSKQAFLDEELTLEQKKDSVVSYLENDVGTGREKLCVITKPMNLYAANTPFESEQWVIMGVRRESYLFEQIRSAQFHMQLIAAVALAICLMSAVWISRRISKPIRNLMEELQKKDPNKAIRLQRLNIEEIDELVFSIEHLSSRVAEAFTKISNIIQMSEVGIGVFEYKEKENLVFCSTTLYNMFGWEKPADETAFVDGSWFAEKLEELKRYQTKEEENLLMILDEKGEPSWFRLSQKKQGDSLLGVLTDVTAQTLEKKKMEYERDYDLLTNISNRRAFEDKVAELFKNPQQVGLAAYIMWDLDNLKFVNDTYGHSTGDEYIISLAKCLKQAKCEQVFSARRSGDEFVTLIYGMEDRNKIEECLKKIWRMIQESWMVLPNGSKYKIRVSAGVAWYPEDTEDYRMLSKYADFAMYMAKHNSKGRMEMFDYSVYEKNRILIQGQEDFNNLLEEHLVRYVLQPIVSVKSGNIYGYEMLMRSTMQELESPRDILKMAHSQAKLYDVEIMTWMEAMKAFSSATECQMIDKESKVFINSVSNQILDSEIQDIVRHTYGEYLPRIVCEFTEEEQGSERLTNEKIQLIRSWKGMIALDDYGCGYNGEATLLKIMPDIVKIDMSIVRGVESDNKKKELIKNLIHFAHEQGILVLAEGVETKEEMEALIGLGTDLLQGYYLAEPTFDASPPKPEILQQVLEMFHNAGH